MTIVETYVEKKYLHSHETLGEIQLFDIKNNESVHIV